MRALVAVVCTILASVVSWPCHAVSLAIPSSHPRLWFGDAARLQQAKAYFSQHPISPASSDFYARALNGVVNGNVNDCKAAASNFQNYIVGANESFRDDIRQNGEELLLMFDWCHDQFTATQIEALTDRWNGYMAQELADNLGNAGKEANNYWAGRTTNLLLWGIASFGDTDTSGQKLAQTYIDEALVNRMGTQFTRWYGDFGIGGVFPEGDEYGVVSLSYPLIAFRSAADFGYDPFHYTNYYREGIYALIYGSTPGPSSIADGVSNEYSLFPFNDDEQFYDGGAINARRYLGDYATLFGTRAPSSGNSKHVLAWQQLTHAGRRSLFDALGTSGNITDLNSLPLDYYAPGAEVLDMRTSHDPTTAMQVHLQLGTPGGIEHRHLDGGSFQVWRKGRWLTRESTGYSNPIVPYRDGAGTIDVSEAPAHNALLFEGRSTGIWIGDEGPQVVPDGDDQPRGLPKVVRLQHAAQFAFVAADYSMAYRNGLDTRVDWPYADTAIREFLFIRPLQVLLILDRTRGSSDSQRPFYSSAQWLEGGPIENGANVRRSFIMHFEAAPTANAIGDYLDATIGNQTSELIALLPVTPFKSNNPNFRIVSEDVPGDTRVEDEQAGQFRLELDASGSIDSYFLNVVTGYDASEARIAATLQDLGDHWNIQLTHPTRGSAIVTLLKGMVSTGGSIQIGAAAATPLSETVQGIHVTDDGPVWDSDVIFANGFDASPGPQY